MSEVSKMVENKICPICHKEVDKGSYYSRPNRKTGEFNYWHLKCWETQLIKEDGEDDE